MSTGLVIGATGGIGAACAAALSGSVDEMIVTGRDASKLAGIAGKHVVADLATKAGRDAIIAAVRATAPLRWVVVDHCQWATLFSSHRSASIAAMQPEPAAVIAWR